jgi:hypothetical protein
VLIEVPTIVIVRPVPTAAGRILTLEVDETAWPDVRLPLITAPDPVEDGALGELDVELPQPMEPAKNGDKTKRRMAARRTETSCEGLWNVKQVAFLETGAANRLQPRDLAPGARNCNSEVCIKGPIVCAKLLVLKRRRTSVGYFAAAPSAIDPAAAIGPIDPG